MKIKFYSSFLAKHWQPAPFIMVFGGSKWIDHSIVFSISIRPLCWCGQLNISWKNHSGRY